MLPISSWVVFQSIYLVYNFGKLPHKSRLCIVYLHEKASCLVNTSHKLFMRRLLFNEYKTVRGVISV